MTLTKNDLIAQVSMTGIPKNISEKAVDYIIQTMRESLIKGEDLLISSFGRITVKDKKQRKGRNPATGEAMMLSARKVVTFKCSKKLKKILNP